MAKQSVLDIIINTIKKGGGDQETVKGLVNVKSSITGAMTAFAALAGAAYTVDKALDATAGVYVNYVQRVEESKRAMGLSAEETSRVIALTDDLGISYEELSASLKKNADNTNFSIDGLARSSAEYLKLETASDRAKFAQERYGKQWQEFSKLLEKGPDQVRALAAAVDEGHIFDDEDIRNVEEYRLAVDALQDSQEAVAMSMGETIVPKLTQLTEGMNIYINLAKHEEETYARSAVYRNIVETAMQNEAMAADSATLSYIAQAEAMTQVTETADILAVNYAGLLGAIKDMQSETDRYKETQQEANAAIKAAEADFAAGKINADERNKVLDENKAKLDENAAAHKRWAAETVFAFAQAKAAADGNITEGEGKILIEMGVQLGLFDQATADTMENVNSAFDNVDTENAQQVIEALKEQMEALTNEPWVITVVTDDQTNPITTPAPSPGDGYEPVGAQFVNSSFIAPQGDIRPSDTTTRTDTQGSRSTSGRVVNIYGNVTVYAQSSVVSVLEELGE